MKKAKVRGKRSALQASKGRRVTKRLPRQPRTSSPRLGAPSGSSATPIAPTSPPATVPPGPSTEAAIKIDPDSEGGDGRSFRHTGSAACKTAPNHIANYASGYAIGNCYPGWSIGIQWWSGNGTSDSPSNPNNCLADGNCYYGGYFGGTFDGCGWIRHGYATSFAKGPNSNCQTTADTPNANFMRVANCLPKPVAGASQCTGGAPTSFTRDCTGYGNMRPWATSGALNNPISMKKSDRVEWRYIVKHPRNGKNYVLVHHYDTTVQTPAWVFVERGCLADYLPPSPGASYYCPALSDSQNRAGQCTDPLLDLRTSISGGPSTISLRNGNIGVFAAGPGGALMSKWYDTGGWSNWDSLGGVILGTPRAISWGSDHQDVYARGSDNGLYHRWWDPTNGWHPWERIGTWQITSDPVPMTWGRGHAAVYARGVNGDLVHVWYGNGQWQAFDSLGGGIQGKPSAISVRAGHVDVYVRGTDNGLYHRTYLDGVWYGWERIGATQITSDPAALTWGPGHVDVYARGTDGALIHAWYGAGAWQPWENLGGSIVGNPATLTVQNGHLDIYVRGSDNGLYRRAYYYGWWGWERLGAWQITSDAAPMSWGPGHVDVYARGTDGRLAHIWYGSGAWQQWEAL